MPDHLDEVFERHGVMGNCEYCGKMDVKTRPDPFVNRIPARSAGTKS